MEIASKVFQNGSTTLRRHQSFRAQYTAKLGSDLPNEVGSAQENIRLMGAVQNLRTELDNALRNVEDRLENIGKTKCGDPGTFENDSSSVFCF